VAGKEKLLALGVYPDVTLADARSKRDEAKGVSLGVSIPMKKREEKIAREANVRNTFQEIACEWHSANYTNGLRICLRHYGSIQ
jgi:hypothetical protein